VSDGGELEVALAQLGTVPLGVERIPVGRALGRIAAEELRAAGPIPSGPEAAREGFALDPGSTPVGEHFDGRLPRGRALRVGLEAPLPPGAEAVVPIDEVRVEADAIHVEASVRPGDGVLATGTDGAASEVLVGAGHPLFAARLHLLEKAGVDELPVFRRPRIAVGGGGHPSLPDLVARWMDGCRVWRGPLRHDLQGEDRFDVDLVVEVGDETPGFAPSTTDFPCRPGDFEWGRDPKGRPWLRLPSDPFAAWCAWILVAPRILPGFTVPHRWGALCEALPRETTHRFLPVRLLPRGLGLPLIEVVPREERLWSWLASCDGALAVAPKGPALEAETAVEIACFR